MRISLALLERICGRCGQKKTVREFYTKGKGLDSRCKECVKKIKRAAYRKKRVRPEMKISKVIMVKDTKTDREKIRRILDTAGEILAGHLANILEKEGFNVE